MHTRRPTRPSILKKHSTLNSTASQPQGGASNRNGTPQSSKASTETVTQYEIEAEDEDDMAGFLQFWWVYSDAATIAMLNNIQRNMRTPDC